MKKIATIIVGIPEPRSELENKDVTKDQSPRKIPIRENKKPKSSAIRAGKREVLTSPFIAVSIKTNGVAFDFPNSRFPH
jgi:hypothetical protein